MSATPLEWLIACILGILIGAMEIVSRYRDEPDNALRTWPAIFYMGVNALASALALVIIHVFGWTFGIARADLVGPGQAVVAGLGAMALLRASIFTVKVGETSVPVGPSRLLDTLLDAVQQSVDRKRGEERSAAVIRVMKDVDFNRAYQALPSYCFALLQNLPDDDKEQFGKKVGLLYNADMTEQIKSLLLGLGLMNLVGERVLEMAVRDLGEEITHLPEEKKLPVPEEKNP